MATCSVSIRNDYYKYNEASYTAGVPLNITGNSGLAKGGSGDVLSGLIAGLCASGLSAFDGGVAGAYLMGKAAEIATKEVGEYALIARDVIANLGAAFLSLRE